MGGGGVCAVEYEARGSKRVIKAVQVDPRGCTAVVSMCWACWSLSATPKREQNAAVDRDSDNRMF